MTELELAIGDKNLSSWSLRPWLALKQSGLPFRETMVRLGQPDTREKLGSFSPSGLVPVLRHGDLVIWDSLAICEYVNELTPDRTLWPTEAAARAEARAVSAEMHSGFSNLRQVWPMNFARVGMRHLKPDAVRRDIARIVDIWTSTRRKFGAGGPFLFGRFSIADAMYAPVVSRFMTYGPLDLPPLAAAYVETIFSLPAMLEWGRGAAEEISAETA